MTVCDVARLLPGIDQLREHCRALAMLEGILRPDWESRCYSFNAGWAPGQQMASMRNGSGDEYAIVFSSEGAYVRGFDHESPMSPYAHDGPWPGVVDSVPEVFQPQVEEPAFTDEVGMPVVTACLWRETGDDRWQTGEIDFPQDRDDPDGADTLFALLTDRSPAAYARFAQDIHELPVDPAAVQRILALQPLTPSLLQALNPSATLAALAPDIAETGYPSVGRDGS